MHEIDSANPNEQDSNSHDLAKAFRIQTSRTSSCSSLPLLSQLFLTPLTLQKLDFENPNEQNFILLVVATEEQTEARLSSSATLRVQVDFNELALQSFFPLLRASLLSS